MKRIQQALCTLSTGVLRRLLVCSVGMAAAAVPVSRVTWSQYQTLYNQLRCQRWTTQGRRCFISTSSVWATGEDFIVDSIDDEDKYVCEISNIADSGHQVLVVQPGKTSLIKALTADRQLEPRDQLFATLDVTAHGGTLPNMMSVLFIDTVGFIADIPVMLTEAFAATLEDAVLASSGTPPVSVGLNWTES
ncbi:uncharacterized protein LOC124124366 [Haliotis rufescens]|uniref:uncharacterized protein LOC124124366 n=1 Tax=Haliotis rufescens TaxID=6454 RepID=UPI00201F67A7|nr:uncharacterized protein LOC124124366 [Haliotis rufescens]